MHTCTERILAIGTVGTLCLIKTQHSLFVWSAIVTAAKTFTWAGKEHKYVFNMLFLLKGDCYSNYLLIKEVDSVRETRTRGTRGPGMLTYEFQVKPLNSLRVT